jgi:hypothetical protein
MRAGAKIVPAKRSGSARPESERKWKQFLHEVVNAHENNFDYILKVYAQAGFLPSKTISERAVVLNAEFLKPEQLRSRSRQERHRVVERLREGLRSIWSADDQHTARWRLFNLQNEVCGSTDPTYDSSEGLQPPPADRLVHQGFGYLRRNLRLLRTCANPACQVAPFFIADKVTQKYCSDTCARAGQQKAKAHWWKVEGPRWRKRRRLQQKKVRRPLRKTR